MQNKQLDRLLTSGSGYPKISSRVFSTRADLSDGVNEISMYDLGSGSRRCAMIFLVHKKT